MRLRDGRTAPGLRLAVWERALRVPFEDGFAFDTGCDFDLILARRLRDRLAAAGVRPQATEIRWGRPVAAERYHLSVWLADRWEAVEAYFPVEPTVDENLVGLPLMRFEAVCLRRGPGETWLGHPVP